MLTNPGSKWTPNLIAISLKFIIMILFIIKSSEQENPRHLVQLVQNYCRSLNGCQDCVKSAYRCEWYHNIGCTSNANGNCPKKVVLENSWKTQHNGRICTEIISKSPLFVPANVKRFIKVKLRIGDLTIYEQSITCELHLEGQVHRFFGTLDGSSVYCDTSILRIKSNVAVAYLKLVWGGAEPSSNVILVIVYSCKRLATTCKDCQNLNTELKCGWCKDSMSCSLIEECSRVLAPWITRNLTCKEDVNLPTYFGRRNGKKFVDRKLASARAIHFGDVF